MVKLVDTTDLKSVAPDTGVPVRFRFRAPLTAFAVIFFVCRIWGIARFSCCSAMQGLFAAAEHNLSGVLPCKGQGKRSAALPHCGFYGLF